MNFTKMHGIGNDFVMLDGIQHSLATTDLSSLAKQVCDRRFGVGADGIITLERDPLGLRMRMFNPDGSESQMCGNGLRCFAVLARDLGYAPGPLFEVETGAGRLAVQVTDNGDVSVDMGFAEVGFIEESITSEYRGTSVSMGNPHVVIFVEDVAKVDLETDGRQIENMDRFPERTNVNFAQVVSPTHLIQRTWERGAGATLACGTGACSVAVAGFVNQKTGRKVDIDLPGGRLNLEYREDGHVIMTGPARTVYTGQLN